MLVRASSGSGGGGTVNLEPFCKAWTGGLGLTITGISFTPSKFEFKTSDNYKVSNEYGGTLSTSNVYIYNPDGSFRNSWANVLTITSDGFTISEYWSGATVYAGGYCQE